MISERRVAADLTGLNWKWYRAVYCRHSVNVNSKTGNTDDDVHPEASLPGEEGSESDDGKSERKVEPPFVKVQRASSPVRRRARRRGDAFM